MVSTRLDKEYYEKLAEENEAYTQRPDRFQIARMRTIIRSIDPMAFVTISDVADMFKANDGT